MKLQDVFSLGLSKRRVAPKRQLHSELAARHVFGKPDVCQESCLGNFVVELCPSPVRVSRNPYDDGIYAR